MLIVALVAAFWAIVAVGVPFAQATGWAKSGPIEITALSIVSAVLGVPALIGYILAYRREKKGNEIESAKFVYELTIGFLESDRERAFFYKLDYQDFKFDPDAFALSEDELYLDRLLYKLAFVGTLLRKRLVTLDDIGSIRHIASRTLRNPEVLKYLRYLKQVQIPDHSSYADCVYLFERWFGQKDPVYAKIREYLSPSRPAPYVSSSQIEQAAKP
jgi:hypothetical protein